MPQVYIVVGSKSDLGVVRASGMTAVLDAVFEDTKAPGSDQSWNVPYSYNVSSCSAHRNLPELEEFARSACQDGARVFIGIAGMAAALPGALAGCTGMSKPIIAVPLDHEGLESCISMPPGVPVLTAGKGGDSPDDRNRKRTLKNAAISACQILATGDHQIELALLAYIAKNNKKAEFDIDLKEMSS